MRVIAMSCEKEPLDRIVTGEAERVVYVANPETAYADVSDGFYGVGFPRNAVFEYDGTLYESLSGAWARGQESELERLWKAATPISSVKGELLGETGRVLTRPKTSHL